MVEQTTSTRQNSSEKNSSGTARRSPSVLFTCWNEKGHSTLNPVQFRSLGYMSPCPVCNTVHKLTHRTDRLNGEE
jgi:hypothetical protein